MHMYIYKYIYIYAYTHTHTHIHSNELSLRKALRHKLLGISVKELEEYRREKIVGRLKKCESSADSRVARVRA